MAAARRAAVLAALLALGCRERNGAEGQVRLVHDQLGRKVTLRAPGPVRRIVSLAPSVTEILFALGTGDRLVGVDQFSNHPPEAASIPRVGNDLAPSLERIVALKPDLVVTATSANRELTLEALGQLGVPSFVTKSERVADLATTITLLGDLVGASEAARNLNARIAAELDAIRAQVRQKPRVPVLLVVWTDPLFVVGKGSFADELIELAGGINVARDAGAGFPRYSLERVLRHKPEVILLGSHQDPREQLGFWTRFAALPAVRDGRVFQVDGDLLFRPGPRLGVGARDLAARLHPAPEAIR